MVCGSMLLAGVSLPAKAGETQGKVAYTKIKPTSDCETPPPPPPPPNHSSGGSGGSTAVNQPPPAQPPAGPPSGNQSSGSPPSGNQSSGGQPSGNQSSSNQSPSSPPSSAPVHLPPTAPLTFAAQGDVAEISALGFASTLFGRLDLFREAYGVSQPVPPPIPVKARPMHTKALPLAPVSPWSVYMLANGGVSDRDARVGSDGFHVESVGGTVGVEYRINPNSLIGAAFDYSNPKATLSNNAGTTEANSYQFGLYGGWTDHNFFAQALATVGFQDYRNTRALADTITSSPDGSTFVIAGKTGYLFDVGPTQLGPIGGLTYAHAQVNGYTESGDPALTYSVGRQTAEALIGSVGVQLRAPFVFYRSLINPYLNLTAEDNFVGDDRLIQFNAASTPLIVTNWTVPSSVSHGVYGRVTAGVNAPVLSNVSFTANVSRSFGRSGGDDFYGSGGLKISF